MSRNWLVVVGGVLGVARGLLGIVTGAPNLGSAGALDEVFPGIAAILYFEFAASVALVVVSVWAIVVSNRPSSGAAIKMWGFAFIAVGVIDLIWPVAVIGGSNVVASGIGSLVAFALIGGLLAAGGNRLAQASQAA